MKLSLKLLTIFPILLIFSIASLAKENTHSSDLISKDIKSNVTEKKNIISQNDSKKNESEVEEKSLTCDKTSPHNPAKNSFVDMNSKPRFEYRSFTSELQNSLEERHPKRFDYRHKHLPIKDDGPDSMLPIVMGTAAVIATSSLIYYYGTNWYNFSDSSGYEHPRGWLDSNDIERYCDYLENHYKKPDHVGFKAYATSANGHELGQYLITDLLNDDIWNHWQKGTTSPSLVIEGNLESTKIHYFPVNLDVTGGGIHWTGIVVDTDSKIIEYYDSFGHEAPEAINDRMKMIKRSFEALTSAEYKTVSVEVGHQTDGYNCGVYALHYAELRVSGLSASEIIAMEIDIIKIREDQKSALEIGDTDITVSE